MLAGNPERPLALNSQARPHDVHFSRNETWREAVTLEQFASIAEIVAAIAVLATLVYLVIQLGQAKEQIALIHHHHKVDAGLQLMSSLSDSQHLARIFAELGEWQWPDLGLKSEEDTIRFTAWCYAWMRTEESIFRSNNEEQRATQEQLLKVWLSTSWGEKFWVTNRAIFDADFASKVDVLLAEVQASENKAAEFLATRS